MVRVFIQNPTGKATEKSTKKDVDRRRKGSSIQNAAQTRNLWRGMYEK